MRAISSRVFMVSSCGVIARRAGAVGQGCTTEDFPRVPGWRNTAARVNRARDCLRALSNALRRAVHAHDFEHGTRLFERERLVAIGAELATEVSEIRPTRRDRETEAHFVPKQLDAHAVDVETTANEFGFHVVLL
ncbi:hypothetical protein WJ68_33615 [Burkholderia ubonensis]|uniref:Uncharacterized protein n=1 Tax=Burkholderia ubonensis TaxID=101571 RepID=A0ABD4EB99_9BURK|nr:hypothetical protein WJ68_33615 [Burkholderia ubonensis]